MRCRQPLSEGKAAVWGGLVTGALAGLKADIASAGMTFGGGLLAGGVLGALGAAGLAKGFNLVRGVDVPTLAWTDAVLDDLAQAALLGYLAVAHYGRGRGDWTASEHPAFWADTVAAVLDARRDALHESWAACSGTTGVERDAAACTAALQRWLTEASRDVLARLYPDAPA